MTEVLSGSLLVFIMPDKGLWNVYVQREMLVSCKHVLFMRQL